MIVALTLAVTLHLAPVALPTHHTAVPNVYHDSGDPRAWSGVPHWIRKVGHCIRLHESFTSGHYTAENRTSTASGAYQMIDAMWQGNAKWVEDASPYATLPASSAPPWVQDKVFVHSVQHGGLSAWRLTNCPGTT